jgi:hypothetical protein
MGHTGFVWRRRVGGGIRGYGLNEAFSQNGALVDFCEHGNELSSFLAEYHQLLEEDAVPSNNS